MTTYRTTFSAKRLWIILTLSMLLMFSVLLFFGQKIYQQAPPMPASVVVEDGRVLFTLDDIQRGQNVWQALGGMQQGSIWGHGSYLAPDWSADWLHREAEALLAEVADATPRAMNLTASQEKDLHTVLMQVGIARDPTTPMGQLTTFANHPFTVLKAFLRSLFVR